MPSLFEFKGKMRPLPYALWSFGVFFTQYLAVYVASATQGQEAKVEWWASIMPLRALFVHNAIPDLTLIVAFAYLLIATWALAALAFRRAADADISEWIAVFAIAPVIQIPVILCLCFAPSRSAQDHPPVADRSNAAEPAWPAAALGVVVGMGLTLFAVAMGALLFGVYGFGIFVASPFVIGAATAYFANRKTDLGASRTSLLVASAAALGSIALVMVALEGLVCIAVAAPLGLGVALVGGVLGRAVALSTRRSTEQSLSGLALLPLVFAIETIFPASTSFDTYQSIDVHAPPEAVWQSIIRMDSIDEPLALPFRLGVAYPLRGEIIGEGVGAERRGEFSTGTALESVTEWVPNQKLAFVVVHDVPAMRELSPYQHVHAPHISGYMRTKQTSFELSARSDGHTEIIERSSHELKLEPLAYWLPVARWVVHENNARVLAHIRRHAERGARIAN
jgi:uncharacterized membrane protein YhaH (DUF805 family)